jgi:hypothetical protein
VRDHGCEGGLEDAELSQAPGVLLFGREERGTPGRDTAELDNPTDGDDDGEREAKQPCGRQDRAVHGGPEHVVQLRARQQDHPHHQPAAHCPGLDLTGRAEGRKGGQDQGERGENPVPHREALCRHLAPRSRHRRVADVNERRSVIAQRRRQGAQRGKKCEREGHESPRERGRRLE